LADTINFETYALTRIKEAITDELQSIDGPTGTGEADGGLDGVREPRLPKPSPGSGSRSLPTPD
jgi:hypothetical protein